MEESDPAKKVFCTKPGENGEWRRQNTVEVLKLLRRGCYMSAEIGKVMCIQDRMSCCIFIIHPIV
jgi:hypothetical protein